MTQSKFTRGNALSAGAATPALPLPFRTRPPAPLPPGPAGEDAADTSVPTQKYQTSPNPYGTSAFEVVRLDAKSGHEGLHHGGKPMERHAGMEMPASKPAAKGPHGGMDMPAKEEGK